MKERDRLIQNFTHARLRNFSFGRLQICGGIFWKNEKIFYMEYWNNNNETLVIPLMKINNLTDCASCVTKVSYITKINA